MRDLPILTHVPLILTGGGLSDEECPDVLPWVYDCASGWGLKTITLPRSTRRRPGLGGVGVFRLGRRFGIHLGGD